MATTPTRRALLAHAVLPGGIENHDNCSDPTITAEVEQARGTANHR